MKQNEMAKWIKGLIIFTALVSILGVAFFMPKIINSVVAENAGMSYLNPWGKVFIIAAAVPVFISLIKAWGMCSRIAQNNSFCKENATSLRQISHLCLLHSVIFLGAAVAMLICSHTDVIVLLLIFSAIFAGVFMAVLTAALSHLVEKASLLKQENDLTI